MKRNNRGFSSKSLSFMMFWLLITLGITGVLSSVTSLWLQTKSSESMKYEVAGFSASKDKLFDFSGRQYSQKSDLEKVNWKPTKVLYTVFPKEGDVIGTLEMVSLNKTVRIIQGTSRTQLKKGAGHYINSALPGEIDNCVISGHRETAFLGIGKLVIGDRLVVTTSAGTFVYEVVETRIVAEDDTTVIVPSDDAMLTLTTCYPFNTPGYSPERYIVSAILIESD